MRPVNGGCSACEADLSHLRSTILPSRDTPRPILTVADLFSGCGGLSIGMQRAAHDSGHSVDVRLAVDSNLTAMTVYRKLFPTAISYCKPIEDIFDGKLGSPPSESESDVAHNTGNLHVMLGGPPCQGHSSLNNHSRRDDPRNSLYLRMARAAEILRPLALLIENVPAVTADVRKSFHQSVERLDRIGYKVGHKVIDLSLIGVPQKRRRHVVLAVRLSSIDPNILLSSLEVPICRHIPRTVEWAIHDLEYRVAVNLFDSPSQPQPVSQSRIDWLFDHDCFDLPNKLRPPCHQSDHSYTSMYGRMQWDRPAQTVTTGFNCMGQGRYVHPGQRRVITPHEAARLQMLPDFVDFDTIRTRGALAKLIGNAAPPPLAFAVGKALIPVLTNSEMPDRGYGQSIDKLTTSEL